MADLPLTKLRVADLPTRKPTRFDVAPNAAACAAIAQDLGIVAIRKLRLQGTIAPLNRTDWQLDATLGATVVQDCVITLDPVTTRIDEAVQRHYLANYTDPDADEVEMTDDDSAEPLPTTLDLMALLSEALSLALPAFPRADGAALGDAVYTEKGVEPMTDDDAKPFAGLGALRDALKKDT